MILTTPQAISLFSLAMDFTRDSKFELREQDSRGKITIVVHNIYGERGFLLSATGGPPQPISSLNRTSEALRELVSRPDTPEPEELVP